MPCPLLERHILIHGHIPFESKNGVNGGLSVATQYFRFW